MNNLQLEREKKKLEVYVKKVLSATHVKVGLTTLQKKLEEKEDEIKQLTLQREEAKIAFRREENLIMSAFYDIGKCNTRYQDIVL